MIILATLQDGMVDGQRRAAGKRIRKIVIIGLDNYNIVIAEGSDPATPVGKKFFCKLVHLEGCLMVEYPELVEIARKGMLAFFERHTETPVENLSWAEMDQRFKPGERIDDSSGKLKLYFALKEKGWKDDGAEVSQAA